jgi:hypothetical protein
VNNVCETRVSNEDLAGKEYRLAYLTSGKWALGDDSLSGTEAMTGIIVSISGDYTASGNKQTATVCILGECFADVGESVADGEFLRSDGSAGSAKLLGADAQNDVARARALIDGTTASSGLVRCVVLPSPYVIP